MTTRLPEGTVTLVLADVAGSSLLWESDPERARAELGALDVLVDDLVDRSGGARPLEQGEGDSFVVGFARASDAVGFALELQRRLGSEELRVRVAVHTGEVDVRDGARYDGPTIIRAARLRDLGHGGQTLLSAATRDIVAEGLPEGAGLLDLGSHRLKHLQRPERVWQLTHPDLQARFPALRGAGRGAGNVPTFLTTFVGRRDDLATVARMVREHRVVTITGAGGCGKTRLAVESLAGLADGFPDGVWFCDFGPLTDPELVPLVVRRTMGVPDDPTRSDLDTVCERLETAEALVVLDNCEHLIDACASLTHELVTRTGSVRVLATTREPLGVSGEVAWRVPSLPAPEAIELFGNRARDVRPDLDVDDETADVISEICTRLDGIPLAIELAAARVRAMSLRQVADGLHDRFRLLGRGARTVLARQQTLLASVAWSYDLLTEQQRAVLRRASVFAGAFSLEAAAAVAGGVDIDVHDVPDLVVQLVDRSLLVVHEGPIPGYRMLETIRQFARDRLVESGEAEAISGRHLDHYAAAVAVLFASATDGPAVQVRAQEVDFIAANVRAACDWAVAAARHEAGLYLTSMYVGLASASIGSSRDVRGWLEDLLADPEQASPRARLMGSLALSFVCMLNAHERAVDASAEALRLADVVGDPFLRGLAEVLHGAAVGFVDPDAGIGHLEEALRIADETDSAYTRYVALAFIPQILGFTGPRALAAGRRCVEVTAPTGADPFALAVRSACLAVAGEITAAYDDAQAARDVAVAAGADGWAAKCEAFLAWTMRLRGDVDGGSALLERAASTPDLVGGDVSHSMTLALKVTADVQDGRFDEAEAAAQRHDELMRVFPEGGIRSSMDASIAALRAVAAIALGERERARALVDAAAADRRNGRWPFSDASTTTTCARVARALGEVGDAESSLAEALSIVAGGAAVCAPEALDVAAALRADVGAVADAVRLFAAAEAARARMGTVRPPDPIWDAGAELEALRARLGPDAFDAAWDAGSALSTEDAVAFASRGRGPRQRPKAGWDSLTPTELKVVGLVAEGLSNPQIGERLFVSPRTVSTHLSHVFAKLGVSSRAELAAAATKRDL